MALYKNISNGAVFFSRFKVKINECVPAVEYTETEQATIDRFVEKGILKIEDSKATPKVEAPKAVETPKVEETPVVEEVVEAPVEEVVEAPAEDDKETKRGKKNK